MQVSSNFLHRLGYYSEQCCPVGQVSLPVKKARHKDGWHDQGRLFQGKASTKRERNRSRAEQSICKGPPGTEAAAATSAASVTPRPAASADVADTAATVAWVQDHRVEESEGGGGGGRKADSERGGNASEWLDGALREWRKEEERIAEAEREEDRAMDWSRQSKKTSTLQEVDTSTGREKGEDGGREGRGREAWAEQRREGVARRGEAGGGDEGGGGGGGGGEEG